MRAHPEPFGYPAASRSLAPPTAPPVPTILFVIPERERSIYVGEQFTRVYAHAGNDAMRFIALGRPRLIVVDWDDPSLAASQICASSASSTSVLVTTGELDKVPAMLKAGCHGVLLKPFTPSLLAGRLGRVLKETERARGHHGHNGHQTGTNRVRPDIACPKCGVGGATGFDFSSYRREWYACLSCDHTWLGRRQE